MQSKYSAGKAVDGDIDGNMDHGHCSWAQSLPPHPRSWVVDLQHLYQLENITVYGQSREYIQSRLHHQWGAVGAR